MKLYKNLSWFFTGLILLSASCKTEIDVPSPSRGSADFTKYIAIGNSLTAGFADGGLYLSAQKNSYPSILAAQMKAAGGGEFKQPLFTDAQANGSGYLKLTGFDANGSPTLANETTNLAYRAAGLLTKYTEEVQNLGVPGMRLDFAFVPQISGAINYFERLLPDNKVGTTTYFAFVQGRNHTFFTSWIGNNDVLGWAMNGAVTEDAKTVLTDKQTFSGAYSNLLNALTAQGQKGVLATIPEVTSFPYFNTVTVDALLAGAKKVNPAAVAIFIQTSAGARAATKEDLITLPFNSTGLFGKPNAQSLPYGLHPGNPIASKYVLDKSEVAVARDYVNAYNNTIRSLASSKGLAVVDAYAFLNSYSTMHTDHTGHPYMGEFVEGINVSAAYITGNLFSLDGIHLTQRGYAIVANEFIRAINLKYSASLSTVPLSNYEGVRFP